MSEEVEIRTGLNSGKMAGRNVLDLAQVAKSGLYLSHLERYPRAGAVSLAHHPQDPHHRTTQLELTRGVGPFAGGESTGDRYTA
ncbi:hypothetical protein [Streptomyces sp. 891-h]|uniref:hypothetical protein n=1 Tax=unclassified Streptomyces TaxID=2593676 RepID=UPI001FAA7AAE|nr:hypothetical protein [Streptomyces sp. 891-h]UNZ16895.1 hypothetical protein HC362_07260 [Streptomyces sp. 891-h]